MNFQAQANIKFDCYEPEFKQNKLEDKCVKADENIIDMIFI